MAKDAKAVGLKAHWAYKQVTAEQKAELKEAAEKELGPEPANGDDDDAMEVDGAAANKKSKSKGSGGAADGPAGNKRSKIVKLIPVPDDKSFGKGYDVVVVSDAGRMVRIKWDQRLETALGRGVQIIKLKPGEKAVAGCVASNKDTLVMQRSDGYVMHTSFRALKQEITSTTGRPGVTVKFITKAMKAKVWGGGKGVMDTTNGTIVDIQAVYGAAEEFDNTKVTMTMEEYGVKPVESARGAADFFATERVAEVMADQDKYRSEDSEESDDNAMQVDGAADNKSKTFEQRIVAAKSGSVKKKIARDEMYPLLTAEEKEEWIEMERKDKEREIKQKAQMKELKDAWRAENRKDIKESSGKGAKNFKEVKPADLYVKEMADCDAFKAIDADPKYDLNKSGEPAQKIAATLARYHARREVYKSLPDVEKAQWEAKAIKINDE